MPCRFLHPRSGNDCGQPRAAAGRALKVRLPDKRSQPFAHAFQAHAAAVDRRESPTPSSSTVTRMSPASARDRDPDMFRARRAARLGQAFLHQAIDHGIGFRAKTLRRDIEMDRDAAMMALPEGGEIADRHRQTGFRPAHRAAAV